MKVKGLGDVFAGMGQDIADGFGVVPFHLGLNEGDEGGPLGGRQGLAAFAVGAGDSAAMDIDAEEAGLLLAAVALDGDCIALHQSLVRVAAPNAVLAQLVAVDA